MTFFGGVYLGQDDEYFIPVVVTLSRRKSFSSMKRYAEEIRWNCLVWVFFCGKGKKTKNN
jgi:hypothetical protein